MSYEYYVNAQYPDLMHASGWLNTMAEEGWRVVAVIQTAAFNHVQILLEREKVWK